LGIIISTDELIFFRGVGIPPTSWSHVYPDFAGITCKSHSLMVKSTVLPVVKLQQLRFMHVYGIVIPKKIEK